MSRSLSFSCVVGFCAVVFFSCLVFADQCKYRCNCTDWARNGPEYYKTPCMELDPVHFTHICGMFFYDGDEPVHTLPTVLTAVKYYDDDACLQLCDLFPEAVSGGNGTFRFQGSELLARDCNYGS